MACVDCSGGCQWSCSYECGDDCTYGCGQVCAAGCDGSCTGGCNTACVGCKGACNKGCSTTESVNLASLTLTTKFEATNITNIARLIYLEAQRRGKSPSSTSFGVGSKITASEISKLISNLSLAGQTASYSATSGSKANKTLGQNLIDKAKAAYNTTINL